MERVNEFEALLNIETRWRPGLPAYDKAKKYVKERAYRRELDHVEKLIVQRLFELEKTHLVSTSKWLRYAFCCRELNFMLIGYAMRTNIAKHMQSRRATVETSITRLNTAAKALDPPRPTISAAEVLSKTFVGEIDFLRDSRNDIRTKPWADPILKTFLEQYFRLTRAKEELKRLNVEMRRLRTWIRDDEAATKAVVESLRADHPDLSHEVHRRLSLKTLVNDRICRQLDEVESYRGFTGIKGCGIGRYSLPGALPFPLRPSRHHSATPPVSAADPAAPQEDNESSASSDDEDERERRMDGMDQAWGPLVA